MSNKKTTTTTTTIRPYTATTSRYTIHDTPEYREFIQSKLQSISSYNRAITPAYKGSRYNVIHNTVQKNNACTHVLNINLDRIIHNSLLRPELECDLEKHNESIEQNKQYQKQQQLSNQQNIYNQQRNLFKTQKIKNKLLQHKSGQTQDNIHNHELMSLQQQQRQLYTYNNNDKPKWQNITISSNHKRHTYDNNDSNISYNNLKAIQLIHNKQKQLYQQSNIEDTKLMRHRKNIKQLFDIQRQSNIERDLYLNDIFQQNDQTDIQHIVNPDQLKQCKNNDNKNNNEDSNNNSNINNNRLSYSTKQSSRTVSRPQSAATSYKSTQYSVNIHRLSTTSNMSIQQQQRINTLSQPIIKQSQVPVLPLSHDSFNGLVGDNIVQRVARERRASKQHAKQLMIKQKQDDYELNDNSRQSYNSNISESYYPTNLYIDDRTAAIADEIDQFAANNNL